MNRLFDGRRARRRLTAMCVAGIAAGVTALGLGSASFAAAQTSVPCSAGGPGLVAAINTANSSGGGTITLDKGCTYLLTSANNSGPLGRNGLPVVTSRIVIDGRDATIAGNHTNFRIFQVNAPNGDLTLEHLTLTGGAALAGPGPASGGGALFNNEGIVTIKHGVVTDNVAGAGGGLASGSAQENANGPRGSLTIDHSLVSDNTSFGGGAGGVLNRAGSLTVAHSRITGNTAPGGGGIATGPGNPSGTGSITVIDHSQIDHNTANAPEESGGGGVANGGVLIVDHSAISDNTGPGLVGGGLLNHGSSATLDHSSVTGNTAADGGGIANVSFPAEEGPPGPAPQLTLKHTDVTGNVATEVGGGIFNFSFGGPLGTVTLDHSNVSGNTPDNCFPPGTIAGCTG